MSFVLVNVIYTIGLALGMLLFLEVGRRIGLWRMAVDAEGAQAGTRTVEGALLALLGLLIAFSFSGAAARFDVRRQQIVDEANEIGSAFMLVDLLPPEAQPPLRDSFRLYVDARLEAYRKMPDLVAASVELERSKTLQNEIWAQAVAATRDAGYQPVALQILPAISRMISISTERTVAVRMHPPMIIFVMLAGLMLISSLMAGYGMARGVSRNWVHTIAFVVILALTFYVIRDLEFPRLPGLVGMSDIDNVMVELRKSMG
jgi:hypothetical protein